MCGINGLVFMNGVSRSEEMWKAIRYVFDELMIETQDRGLHATGIASFPRKKGMYYFHKAPVSATEMSLKDPVYNGIVSAIDEDTAVLIGHTRWYTKGKPEINENNHPFDIGNIVGVHNGTVANDDSLFLKHKDSFSRSAEVDSEIIYQLIALHNKNEVTYDGLKEALERTYLRGNFALAFTHKQQPNLVHLIKQERPIDIVFWQEAGVVIYNSQKSFIANAFDKLYRAGKHFGFNASITCKEFELKSDRYLTIDANAFSYEEMFSEPKSLYIQSSTVVTTYVGGTGTSITTIPRTRLSASDSVGRVIEGELDEITGEITIFTSAQIVGLNSDDGGFNSLDNEEPEEIPPVCIECENQLFEYEIHAAFNEGAKHTDAYYCKACHEVALNTSFAG
jgi:amidophosphoribosyltransferase